MSRRNFHPGGRRGNRGERPKERPVELSGTVYAVRFRGAALALAALLFAAGVFQPAHGVDHEVASVRWGSGVATTGARYASIVVNRVSFEETQPRRFPGKASYVCLVLGNRSARLAAYGCDEAPVAASADVHGANATGALRARLRRTDTGQTVGWTTLRYDLRWTATTAATPRLHAGGAACPPLPWAGWSRGKASAVAEAISFGWAEGTVSSSTLGTVRYSPSSMAWPGTLVSSTTAGTLTDPVVPAAPSRAPLDSRCFGIDKDFPLVPTV